MRSIKTFIALAMVFLAFACQKEKRLYVAPTEGNTTESSITCSLNLKLSDDFTNQIDECKESAIVNEEKIIVLIRIQEFFVGNGR